MTDSSLDSWTKKVTPFTDGTLEGVARAVANRRTQATVFPGEGQVYRSLTLTPFNRVRVVILGQDPYHGKGQADGLAFSVPQGVKTPPSLRNIFKEVARDTGQQAEEASTDLSRWASQGVLLLNTVLTVEEGKAASHASFGWQAITDTMVQALSDSGTHIVFMLWGGYARGKKKLVDPGKHLVLEAPHPSPLSAYRGFIGCGHFSEANRYLASHGESPIDW